MNTQTNQSVIHSIDQTGK